MIAALLVACVAAAAAAPAQAQEELLFPSRENARDAILDKIWAETERIDIATWYLQVREISSALVSRHKAGVKVRVIGDRVSIFEIDANTRAEFEYLAANGVPVRIRYAPTTFPYIMHWKSGIFVGQGVWEFGSANWTRFELSPVDSNNYKDETVMFTDDPQLVAAARSRFDQFWADTTSFLDWPEAYRRETGNTWPYPMTIDRTRLEPNVSGPSTMVWEQGPVLNNRMASEISAETNGVDIVIYRLSNEGITNALLNRIKAGVPVRIFVEPEQYRQIDWPEYWLTGTRVDQLWVAGARIKQRSHIGLTHMKVLITSRYAMHGSSNFTNNWQRDHNYFIPASTRPALYNELRDEFDRMWNDTVHYRDFYPKPPNRPVLSSPADGATGVSTTPKLVWNRTPWAVFFDVYLGTTSSNLIRQATVNAVLTENPPSTYGWTPSTPLQPGTRYYWRVVARTFATEKDPSLVAASSIRSFVTSGSGGGESTPYGGTPAPVPGTVQAENFDEGPSGIAYFDTTSGNSGGAYRATNVDIESTADTGGGYNLGWMAPTEWVNYTVNVTAAGTYDIEFRVAASGAGGTFHLEVNGADKTGTLSIPNTGGWQKWTTIKRTNVSLAAGRQVWRLVIDAAGPTGVVGNLNLIRVVAAGEPPPPGESTPHGGTPAPLPGLVQAENFDEGGEAVAYHDTTAVNSGGKYRATGVDIENTADAGGGYNVGWMAAGEWLNYTVTVGSAGTYNIEFRIASNGGGGTFHLESNGANKTGAISIPNTGGWQNWTTVTRTVSLAAGEQVFRLVTDSAGPTGAVMNVNYFRVVAGGGEPPPTVPEIVIYAADVPSANVHGNWAKAGDATAAAGVRLASADLAAPTVNTPAASPANYVDVSFQAQAGVRYRLWLRINAEGDSKWNDSLFVQFSGAVNSSGTPIYRMGTTQGLTVNQATCSTCTPAGWGWHSGAYWLADTGEIRFASTGTQTMRIQIREDGVQLDQIVLSPSQYLTTPPGPAVNDNTIVPKP